MKKNRQILSILGIILFILITSSLLLFAEGVYSVTDCENQGISCYRDKDDTDCTPFLYLDPFPPTNGYKWYRGVTHTHSSNSHYDGDGLKGPYYVANLYRKLGYDWVMISDHDRYTWVNNFGPYYNNLPGASPCQNYYGNQEVLKCLNLDKRGKGFVVIEGEEIGSSRTGSSKHVTGFDLVSDPAINDINTDNNTLQQNINLVVNNNLNSLPFINHPKWSYLTSKKIRALSTPAWSMEINKAAEEPEKDAQGRPNSKRDINIWDKVNINLQGQNWWYSGIGSDDSHSKDNDPDDCIDAKSGTRWIVIKLPVSGTTDELTERNISSAVAAESFYSSSGVVLDFNPEINTGSSFSVTAINADEWRKIVGRVGAKNVDYYSWGPTNGAPVNYPFNPGEYFVRFEFRKSFSHNEQAWTNIFFNSNL